MPHSVSVCLQGALNPQLSPMSLTLHQHRARQPCSLYAACQRVQQRRPAAQHSQAPWQQLEYSAGHHQRRDVSVHAGDAAGSVATPPASDVHASPPLADSGVVFDVQASPLVYSGVIFDMDGTLTVSNIDYVTMRKQTGIPVGDLFTVGGCGLRAAPRP